MSIRYKYKQRSDKVQKDKGEKQHLWKMKKY